MPRVFSPRRQALCLRTLSARLDAVFWAAARVAIPSEVQAHVALVINVGRDMLLGGPITTRKGVLRLRDSDREVLNTHSRFLEVDLNPERIVDIKDASGNSVLEHYRSTRKRCASIWRFSPMSGPIGPLLPWRPRRVSSNSSCQ
ncbi:MAG TPA: hypothetical protein VHJ19_00535 [Gammaproteobacteria bacterium]|nr:hypothetical protein [Gammaproteobacteria bacterium]